jgi:hypothetical protein
MVRLVSDDALRETLAIAGPQRAQQFSWKDTAQAALDAVLDAVREG